MPEAENAAKVTDDQKKTPAPAAAQVSYVRFGKGIDINPSKRLPLFDNGSSLAFEAYDERGKAAGSYIAIVADMKKVPRLGHVSSYSTLLDAALFRLVQSGVCYWTPTQSQRYVFIYRYEHDACLVEKGGFAKVGWKGPEIIENFIRPISRVIKEMHDRNFFHGSIRANNIFYSTVRISDSAVLGDCLSVQPSSTQDAIYETIERGIADPMGRGEGVSADDMYAFGVAIAMFLRTHDPLSGLSDEQIIKQKIEHGSYTAIVGRERYAAHLLTLLRGLLHDDPTLRWGVEELFAWLDGGRMSPPQAMRKPSAMRHLTYMGEKYFHLRGLALDLHKNPNETIELIQSGALGQWIEKSLNDKDAHERYEEAIKRSIAQANGNPDALICNVRMALAPMFPIYYKGYSFMYEGVGSLLAQAFMDDKGLNTFREIFALNFLVNAILARGMSGNAAMHLIRKFEAAKSAVKQPKAGFGLERCVYTLCDDVHCLSPKLKSYIVRARHELMDAFEDMGAKGEKSAMFLDWHSMAYLSVIDANSIESALYDLNTKAKDKIILGNLKCLATLQKRMGSSAYPEVAKIFKNEMSGVYKKFHNRAYRKKVEESIERCAKSGDLTEMLALVDDPGVNTRDYNGFMRAKQEYQNLKLEYQDLQKRMERKGDFGVARGRSIAAVIAWIFATALTVLSVLATLSGNSIF